MFLALLNSEEKKIFLQLAMTVASADGNFDTEENVMIQGYCHEMQIDFKSDSQIQSIDALLAELKKSCIKNIKIVLFELIGLAMIDKKYDESEKIIINKIQNEFNISHKFVEECKQTVMDYILFQEKLNKLVLE